MQEFANWTTMRVYVRPLRWDGACHKLLLDASIRLTVLSPHRGVLKQELGLKALFVRISSKDLCGRTFSLFTSLLRLTKYLIAWSLQPESLAWKSYLSVIVPALRFIFSAPQPASALLSHWWRTLSESNLLRALFPSTSSESPKQNRFGCLILG